MRRHFKKTVIVISIEDQEKLEYLKYATENIDYCIILYQFKTVAPATTAKYKTVLFNILNNANWIKEKKVIILSQDDSLSMEMKKLVNNLSTINFNINNYIPK